MTVNELIEVLEKLQDAGKGGYEIVVQYRNIGEDYCGNYCGVDHDIWFDVNETKKLIVL